jgi:dTDP-D-glucose 4,6-dehydratase
LECVKRFVYGEWDRYNSTNPYSATKAGAEELCLAWANTYKLPVKITHCMNLIGERQHWEKYIPKVIRTALCGGCLTIHASPGGVPGSRFYLHCRNAADAVLFVLADSQMREKYNIVGQEEIDNLTLARMIADITGKRLNYELTDFHSQRPGHDLRYGLDGTKLARLGWSAPVAFTKSLERTVEWFLQNLQWLNLTHGPNGFVECANENTSRQPPGRNIAVHKKIREAVQI